MKKQLWAAGAVAALLAVCASGAMAQDTTANPNPGPTVQPVTFTPMTIPTITAPPMMDYKVLANQPFTAMDLEQAHREGLSDRQIAMCANVAKMTMLSFHEITEAVLRGESFPMLCEQYSLNIAKVYDVHQEMQTLREYKLACQTTGYDAMRNTRMNGSPYPMMDSSMESDTSGSMNGSTDSGTTAPTDTATPTPPAAPATDNSTTTDNSGTNGAAMASDDVVSVAMATPRLSMLVKAIQAAGLADTLKGQGPFTIFAPDNAAFRHLPKGALAKLMADPTALTNVLEYHVISGQKIDAATAMSMSSPTSPPTLQGGTLQVTTVNGKVMINDATVVKADIQASNGIIHIINRVLMPPAADATGGQAPTAGATPGQ